MTLVHFMNLMTAEDLASASLSASLVTHFDSTLLPIFQQHGRRISAVSPSDERKSEANDKMMLMANAETHLGLLKTGLTAAEDDDEEPMEEERKLDDSAVMEKIAMTEASPSLQAVEQLLTLFASSKVQEMDTYPDDISFPTVNTAPNFKQTFD